VIIPSHAGFDGSSEDVAIHDIHNVTVFYQELMDLLGLTNVDLVAHSLGGMFAAELAAVSPGLIRRLVLAAPLGLWIDEAPVPDFISSGGNALMRMLWANPSGAVPFPSSTSTPEEAEVTVAYTANLSAATNYLWPLPDRGLKHRIHRVKVPTLLLWGDSDRVVGAPYRERFNDLIIGSRVAVLPNTGHMLFDEQPAAAAEAVLAFLA
jgi:pimeloyl-ACP methyl ester carboxylesterase